MPDVRTRTPRIALVIDHFDGRRGGAALWTRGYAAWLAAHDCAVHVVTRSIGPAEAPLPITFHVLDVDRSVLAFPTAVAARLLAIAPLVSHDMGASIGCDVLQPHVGTGLACWRGSVASYPAWFQPLKRLCGYAPRRLQLNRVCRAQFASESTLFVAVSAQAAHDMQALHGVAAERIRVVRNGVDLSRFAPAAPLEATRAIIRRHLGIHPDDVLLIAVAHNYRLKGAPGLMRAVRRLRRAGHPVKLLLCGGSGPRLAWRSHDNAIIHGGIVDEVAPYYAAADVCVHPTYYDACSLVTLEAMAAGLPVVTTRANGASELITPGVDGIVLESPHRVGDLVAALAPLVRDRALRESLGAAARRAVLRCSPEKNYREIVDVYSDALQLRGVSPAPLERLQNSSAGAGPSRWARQRCLDRVAHSRMVASLLARWPDDSRYGAA